MPLELRLKFGMGCHGRVHITEVSLLSCFLLVNIHMLESSVSVWCCFFTDFKTSIWQVNDDTKENPFSDFRIGQTLTARIVEKASQDHKKKHHLSELSIRPRVLAGIHKLLLGIL